MTTDQLYITQAERTLDLYATSIDLAEVKTRIEEAHFHNDQLVDDLERSLAAGDKHQVIRDLNALDRSRTGMLASDGTTYEEGYFEHAADFIRAYGLTGLTA